MIRILCNRLPTTSVSHTCLRYYLQNSTRVVTRQGFHRSSISMAEAAADQTFKIVELKGDLFDSPPTESLAHCVSEDLHMGKGIAVEFKKQFKRVSELKSQGKKVGDVAVLKKDDRYIYYLITKKQYNHKPSYRTLTMALEAMKKHCVENKVKNLSMPKIGCGLDRLDWGGVSNILDEVFKDTDITITVYTL